MTTRFRTERCDHGLAVGLCAVATCKGSQVPRAAGRQLLVKHAKCKRCSVQAGNVTKRGPFYGTRPDHPGWQEYWCDRCWELRLARDAAAELRRKSGRTPRFRGGKRPAVKQDDDTTSDWTD